MFMNKKKQTNKNLIFTQTALGYLVHPRRGVHVPQSLRQDILGQVVRKPREEIQELR